MSTELVIGLLGGGGIAAVVAAIVNGLFTRRKLSADAAEIITKAAAGVVTNLQAELDRQVTARVEMRTEHAQDIARIRAQHAEDLEEMRDDHAEEMNAVRRSLREHVEWDEQVFEKLKGLGIDVPKPPSIMPPRQVIYAKPAPGE